MKYIKWLLEKIGLRKKELQWNSCHKCDLTVSRRSAISSFGTRLDTYVCNSCGYTSKLVEQWLVDNIKELKK